MDNCIVAFWIKSFLGQSVDYITSEQIEKYKKEGLTESKFFRWLPYCPLCGKKLLNKK